MDKKKIIPKILINLSKAFDSTDHDRLLYKICYTATVYGHVIGFSFFSKTLASEVSVREQAWSARKKNKKKLFSSSPTPTPLHWRSINPLHFIFYHAHSTKQGVTRVPESKTG